MATRMLNFIFTDSPNFVANKDPGPNVVLLRLVAPYI